MVGGCGRWTDWNGKVRSEQRLTGWNPAKGFERDKTWQKKWKKGDQPKPFGRVDQPKQQDIEGILFLFQFASHKILDILQDLRTGKMVGHGVTFGIILDPDKDDEYWRQMDSKRRRLTFKKGGGSSWEWWKPTHARDHYLDCEIQGLAFALWKGLRVGIPIDKETLA